MQRWLYSLTVVGTAALLAACGGGNTGTSVPSSPPNVAPMAPTAAPTAAPVNASGATQQTVLGAPAWANPSGLTLYMFAPDPINGTPTCNGACASTWPPFVASPGAQAASGFSILTRSDGSHQWAFNGHALYTYAGDSGPGQGNGNNLNSFGGLWTVSRPAASTPAPPAPTAAPTVAPTAAPTVAPTAAPPANIGTVNGGQAWINPANSLTLYTLSSDPLNGTPSCSGTCAAIWPPFMAAAGSRASGGFTMLTRTDGSLQWAFNGQPLYNYAGDTAAGQGNGEGINSFGGIWHVSRPAGAAPAPTAAPTAPPNPGPYSK